MDECDSDYRIPHTLEPIGDPAQPDYYRCVYCGRRATTDD